MKFTRKMKEYYVPTQGFPDFIFLISYLVQLLVAKRKHYKSNQLPNKGHKYSV